MTAFSYRTGERIGHVATLGLVVLQSDETIEHDFHRLLPDQGVALYVSRVPSAPEVTSDTLAQMSANLPAAAGLFPDAVRFDAVGYGCTSGTAVIGAARVAGLIKGACKTPAVSEPVSGLIAACRHLDVSRVAFLSPYIAEVSARLRDVLGENGITTPVFGSFDEAEEARVAQIDTASIIDAACALGKSDAVDAVFLSCTNLRTLDVIAPIEDVLGKPVLSSNQVLAWHLMQLAGASLTSPQCGRLLRGSP